jgi:hypothetical protein
MTKRLTRSEYPLWVKLGIWGVPGRGGLWFFFWLSISLAVACVAYGFVNPVFFAGVGFVFSALMYWLTIRWIDANGTWRLENRPDDVEYGQYD